MSKSTILVSVSAGGEIVYWHAASGKSIINIRDPTNSDLYALDFSKSGDLMAVAGKDHSIKIYDDSTKSIVSVLNASDTGKLGHSNRVFSVKFTDDPNLLVSGGWDNTVFFWDLRTNLSSSYIYGPHICGDSMDVRGDVLLTGSYNNKNVLQLWSLSKRQLIARIPWNGNVAEEYDQGYLYTAMFDKNKKNRFIVAGGAGRNEVHFHKNSMGYGFIGKATLDSTVTSVDMLERKNTIAVGCGDGMTYTFDFELSE